MAFTKYLWDPLSDNVLMEKDENNVTTARYTHLPGLHGKLISQNRGGVESFFHYDGEGNTRALTDINGNVTDRYTYNASGEVLSHTGNTTNPFGFKGALGYYANPETNDYYVRARTYEPTIARWLSADPIGFVDGMNLYAYVMNDPVNKVDSSGEQYHPKYEQVIGGGETFPKIPRLPSDSPYYCQDNYNGSRDIAHCIRQLIIFRAWLEKERRRSSAWLNELDDCLCDLTYCGLPEGWEYDRAAPKDKTQKFFARLGLKILFGRYSFHPGASYCTRSPLSPSGHSQQCCYDFKNELITHGPGAGTPDFNNPEHPEADVDPWTAAVYLDEGQAHKPHVRVYEIFRKPNKGKNCPMNPPPPLPDYLSPQFAPAIPIDAYYGF